MIYSPDPIEEEATTFTDEEEKAIDEGVIDQAFGIILADDLEKAARVRDAREREYKGQFVRLGIRPDAEPAEYLVDGLSLEEYLAELEDVRNQFETAFRGVGRFLGQPEGITKGNIPK